MLYSTITLLALKKCPQTLWIPSLMCHLSSANKEMLTVRDPIPLRAVTLPRALANGCVTLRGYRQIFYPVLESPLVFSLCEEGSSIVSTVKVGP